MTNCKPKSILKVSSLLKLRSKLNSYDVQQECITNSVLMLYQDINVQVQNSEANRFKQKLKKEKLFSVNYNKTATRRSCCCQIAQDLPWNKIYNKNYYTYTLLVVYYFETKNKTRKL